MLARVVETVLPVFVVIGVGYVFARVRGDGFDPRTFVPVGLTLGLA